MKLSIYLLLSSALVLAFLSCQKEDSYVILSGQLDNAKNQDFEVQDFDQICYFVVRQNDVIKTIDLSEDGTFRDTLYNIEEGNYQLNIGSKPIIYLREGYRLHLTADANDFDHTLTFSGLGSGPNNYLHLKERLGKSFTSEYKLSEELYIAKKDSIKNVMLAALSDITDEASFVATEHLNVDHHHIYSLYTYQGWHGAFTRDRSFKVSPDFPMKQSDPELIEGFDYNNEEKYIKSIFYRNIENSRIRHHINRLVKEENLEWHDAKLEYLKRDTTINESVEYHQMTIFLQNFSAKDIDATNELYQELMDYAKGKEKLEAKIQSYYDKIMSEANRLSKGQPSPKFVDYENYNGGTNSLDDFRGKYVFIDFWATWCGPCLKQIPHLKKIEKKYHDKNIVFIGISTDKQKDKAKWREYVEKYEMGGVQLLTDNSSYSDFYQDYGISSIPRFLLIDPDGNIVSSEAPYPSDPKLVDLLESLDM